MTRRRFILFFFIIALLLIFLFFDDNNVYEEVYDLETNITFSGDKDVMDDDEYEIYVTDSDIIFYDSKGNSIIYTFENDRLKNVFNVYNAKNEVEAKKIAMYFTSQVGNGEILKVDQLDTTVSVQMDINYFSDYKDYTKKQIEEILLEDTNVVKEEE